MMGYRKLIGLVAALLACVLAPSACPSISIIAVAFFGAHAAQDWGARKSAATKANAIR